MDLPADAGCSPSLQPTRQLLTAFQPSASLAGHPPPASIPHGLRQSNTKTIAAHITASRQPARLRPHLPSIRPTVTVEARRPFACRDSKQRRRDATGPCLPSAALCVTRHLAQGIPAQPRPRHSSTAPPACPATRAAFTAGGRPESTPARTKGGSWHREIQRGARSFWVHPNLGPPK